MKNRKVLVIGVLVVAVGLGICLTVFNNSSEAPVPNATIVDGRARSEGVVTSVSDGRAIDGYLIIKLENGSEVRVAPGYSACEVKLDIEAPKVGDTVIFSGTTSDDTEDAYVICDSGTYLEIE